jgi:hypothetical protein
VELRGDCTRCVGLCRVIPAFAASADYGRPNMDNDEHGEDELIPKVHQRGQITVTGARSRFLGLQAWRRPARRVVARYAPVSAAKCRPG